ncbi:fatty acid desaturase [Solimonas variicoloris]|uniref:fatty acid desaturase n=1 Tax=Solimonas variicoloris TaxID=254408 RepID=UPI001FE11293|nr:MULTISPECIES: fatty acid desaturase [Solimonas]
MRRRQRDAGRHAPEVRRHLQRRVHAHVARRDRRRLLIETFAMSGLYAALLTWATLAGYLWPALRLVLLPQRLAVFVLAWSFDWLPHHGLRDTARSNRYQATRNRIGRERLLNPLMLWQNYHLVHHLHPSIPFFTYRRVWLRNEAHYLAQEPPLATAFGRTLTAAAYRRARGLPPPAVAGSGRRLEFHALRVADLQRLTDDSVAIRFAVPDALRETFRFDAGQHLTLRAVIDGMSCRRSHSICSPAPDGALASPCAGCRTASSPAMRSSACASATAST